MIRPSILVVAALFASTAHGADLDVPITEMAGDGQAATCSSATVVGLDPNGDGFLAVRTGPGSNHRKIDELHNGDVVYIFEGVGQWVGVTYGNIADGWPDSCGNNGPARRVRDSQKGWVHSNWLRGLAG
ncbi:SH3 domain-containing protein [Palleronia pelagia]|uniref:SH3 domain-containing protein n=1 Tax=Palleronia pelagia TaxID=387096 RepID=A0A1H8FG59_9RHOB|nr:SH3 domain-containing protein [Palleronia pelagia]SEN30068.1 SH3 domain-containing protein [Palleronia pelagia]